MQFQSDLLQRKVCRPCCLETTALGAAMQAGLAVGMWDSLEELKSLWKSNTEFSPALQPKQIEHSVSRWHKAVKCCLNWEKDD
jgi:glycerol kinase